MGQVTLDELMRVAGAAGRAVAAVPEAPLPGAFRDALGAPLGTPVGRFMVVGRLDGA